MARCSTPDGGLVARRALPAACPTSVYCLQAFQSRTDSAFAETRLRSLDRQTTKYINFVGRPSSDRKSIKTTFRYHQVRPPVPDMNFANVPVQKLWTKDLLCHYSSLINMHEDGPTYSFSIVNFRRQSLGVDSYQLPGEIYQMQVDALVQQVIRRNWLHACPSPTFTHRRRDARHAFVKMGVASRAKSPDPLIVTLTSRWNAGAIETRRTKHISRSHPHGWPQADLRLTNVSQFGRTHDTSSYLRLFFYPMGTSGVAPQKPQPCPQNEYTADTAMPWRPQRRRRADPSQTELKNTSKSLYKLRRPSWHDVSRVLATVH